MKKLALLLSLLALGALGLVACGGGADEDTTTEAKVSADTTTETKVSADTTAEAKLSREQVKDLTRVANYWAPLFARFECNRYMSQPVCVRMGPVSAAFQKSFADATVEDIKFKRIVLVGPSNRPVWEAAVTFSNGEVVEFGAGPPGGKPSCPAGPEGAEQLVKPPGDLGSCPWGIADPPSNRRFFEAEAAAPRE